MDGSGRDYKVCVFARDRAEARSVDSSRLNPSRQSIRGADAGFGGPSAARRSPSKRYVVVDVARMLPRPTQPTHHIRRHHSLCA